MPSRPRSAQPLKSAKKRAPARGRPFVRGVADTRAELIAAARDLFLENGPAQFSLREVARRVGVSAAAVYRHFDNKEALLLAACTQGFHVFSGYLVRALAARTPRERLLATTEQYRSFALENPLDYRFIFMTIADKARYEARESLPQDTTFQFLVDRVRECTEADVLAPNEPTVTAVLIWAHVHGLVSLRLSEHLRSVGTDEAFTSLYRASVERLLRGLA
ncbi:MAG: TetR/AcrR family transcriptional regulator [Pseudomonadota bacterium]